MTKENEEMIVNALEDVCKKLGPVEGMCKEAIETYVPQYFRMARDFLTNPKVSVGVSVYAYVRKC